MRPPSRIHHANRRNPLTDPAKSKSDSPDQLGTEVSKSDWMPTLTAMMESDTLSFSNQRCLYENEEIMVEHSFMAFPDGTSEAVMVVNLLKDGKIIRTETGATPIK